MDIAHLVHAAFTWRHALKVSRYLNVDWPGGTAGAAAPLDSALQRIAHLHRDGYAGVWLAEAQPHAEAVAPAISLLAAGAATATAKAAPSFEIGVITSLRPFMHPLRVAEEIAMLDIASEGRVQWAADGSPCEDARFREQLEIIRTAITGDETSHEGAFYRFEDVRCHPAPHSETGPRLHLVATDREAATWAHDRELGVLWNGPGSTLVGEPPAAAEREDRESLLICAVYVAARDTAAVESVAHAAASGFDVRSSHQVAGDAASCRDQLCALRENVGTTHVVVQFEFGNLDADDVAASEARFLDDVLPAIA